MECDIPPENEFSAKLRCCRGNFNIKLCRNLLRKRFYGTPALASSACLRRPCKCNIGYFVVLSQEIRNSNLCRPGESFVGFTDIDKEEIFCMLCNTRSKLTCTHHLVIKHIQTFQLSIRFSVGKQAYKVRLVFYL